MTSNDVLDVIRTNVGPCREWCDEKFNICGEPPEYVLWGKLIPADGLGPRCYVHAAGHVGHAALGRGSGWAILNLGEIADRVVNALEMAS